MLQRKNIIIILLVILTACTSSEIENNEQWYYEELELKELWSYSKGDSQTIAIIDTGISKYGKEVYADRIVDTYNSIDGSKDVTDEHGHGTEMVSIASGDGQDRVWGGAPKSKILVIKAIGDDGKEASHSIEKAIEYAISKKVSIINMSFGTFKKDDKIEKLIQLAIKKGITIVASTGDYGNNDILFPSSATGVVSVEAKNKKGGKWEKSNTSLYSIAAFPGEEIKSLTLGNSSNSKPFNIVYSTGTSQATALASGYIALIRDYYNSKNITSSNTEILNKLRALHSTTEDHPDYLSPFQ